MIDARLMLRTDDDPLTAMTYTGFSYLDLAEGGQVRDYDPTKSCDAADVYGRTTRRFETGAAKYYRLNHPVAAA